LCIPGWIFPANSTVRSGQHQSGEPGGADCAIFFVVETSASLQCKRALAWGNLCGADVSRFFATEPGGAPSGLPLRRRGTQVLHKRAGGGGLWAYLCGADVRRFFVKELEGAASGQPLRRRGKQVLHKRAGGGGPWTYLCGAGVGRFGVKEGPGCKACCAFRGGFSWPIVRSDLDSVKVANPDEPIA